MKETIGLPLNDPEFMPKDPYQESRLRPSRVKSAAPEKQGKLKRFLENDRKVLRFYCIWDDRDSMFGELREFVSWIESISIPSLSQSQVLTIRLSIITLLMTQ